MSDPLGGGGASPGGRDDVKTQFITREGLYKLMALSEYSRPNRIGYAANPPGGAMAGGGGGAGGAAAGGGGAAGANAVQNRMASVRVSFSISKETPPPPPTKMGNGAEVAAAAQAQGSKIVFNYGREIFVYPYRGIRKAADLTKPIDKRIYKGTCPTCHDFGTIANLGGFGSKTGGGHEDITPLLVGFTQGQIQLVDPVRKDLSKLYNEERLIDKSCVTCIKWVPGGSAASNLFLVSFSSGCLYVFNHELPCSPAAPVYQLFKQGEGYSIFTCKAKSTRNPIYKWQVGHGAINQFAFSPCGGHFLATASQDGYMRLFNYDSMELAGMARSYFGGFTCLSWSPDGRYIACGGEDDLVTIYSVAENRVVARGQGHKSWVSQVSFDEYNLSYGDVPDGLDFSGSDEEGGSSSLSAVNGCAMRPSPMQTPSSSLNTRPGSRGDQQKVSCYRLGSVGEDAHLCLWDLTEDLLKKASLAGTVQPTSTTSSKQHTPRCSSPDRLLNHHHTSSSAKHLGASFSSSKDSGFSADNNGHSSSIAATTTASTTSTTSSLSQRFASLNFGDRHKDKDKGDKDKEHKRNFSLSTGSGSKLSISSASSDKASISSLASIGGGSSTFSASSSAAPAVPEYVKLGSLQCPRIGQVPLVEPLVSKRISQERLTSLVFLEDCFVTACQEGYICTWARPGRGGGSYSVNMMCPGSPPQNSSGGTVV